MQESISQEVREAAKVSGHFGGRRSWDKYPPGSPERAARIETMRAGLKKSQAAKRAKKLAQAKRTAAYIKKNF